MKTAQTEQMALLCAGSEEYMVSSLGGTISPKTYKCRHLRHDSSSLPHIFINDFHPLKRAVRMRSGSFKETSHPDIEQPEKF